MVFVLKRKIQGGHFIQYGNQTGINTVHSLIVKPIAGEYPHGWGKHDLKRKREDYKPSAGTATESDGDEEGEDMPSTKFRRGEALPSDLDLGENDSESPPSEDPRDPDEMDDGDWNMMGAALEREFLS